MTPPEKKMNLKDQEHADAIATARLDAFNEAINVALGWRTLDCLCDNQEHAVTFCHTAIATAIRVLATDSDYEERRRIDGLRVDDMLGKPIVNGPCTYGGCTLSMGHVGVHSQELMASAESLRIAIHAAEARELAALAEFDELKAESAQLRESLRWAMSFLFVSEYNAEKHCNTCPHCGNPFNLVTRQQDHSPDCPWTKASKLLR